MKNRACEYAKAWKKQAADGEKYKMAFDAKNTWSIKYNMVWDKLFRMGLFSDEVYDRELAWYKTKFNTYGLPLDSRSDYTKSDWLLWTATMMGDEEFFNRVVDTMYEFVVNTPDRIPFTDLYFTSKPYSRGFQARTVQGGLYIALM